MVPQPLWGRDLAKLAPRKEWDRLRKQVYERYDNHCGICGAGGRMICHEIWEYDDVNHIQRLTGLIALCSLCNSCKHMGRSHNLFLQGKLDFMPVVEHFCRVNGIAQLEFREVFDAALVQWRERNNYEWTQDFGEYESLARTTSHE